MLPDEVMSLEADILRLRKGIARLTSTASVSAPRYYESGAGSGSSNSTYGENSPRYSELSLKTLWIVQALLPSHEKTGNLVMFATEISPILKIPVKFFLRLFPYLCSRKKLQRPLNGANMSTLSRLSKSSSHSANVRQPRLPSKCVFFSFSLAELTTHCAHWSITSHIL